MEQATGNQQPSEQEQIAALAEQLEEMRQRMFRLEGQAEVLRQMASRPLDLVRRRVSAGNDCHSVYLSAAAAASLMLMRAMPLVVPK